MLNEIAAENTPDELPAADNAPAQDNSPDPKDGEGTAKETPKQDGSIPLSRFNKVYAKSKENERENAQLKDELAKLKQPKEEAPPDPAKYNDQGKYLEDLVSFNGRKAAREEFGKLHDGQKANQKQTDHQARETSAVDNFRTLLTESEKKYPGLGKKLSESPIIAEFSPETSLIVAESKVAGELTHFLLENPEEAEEIAAMPAEAASFAIRRIEKELSKAGNKIPAPQVSKMPKPPTPVGAGKHQPGARTEDETIEQMTARLFPLG